MRFNLYEKEKTGMSDLAKQSIHNGERFYAFHNARLYDENENQIASIEEPLFLSIDITNMPKEEIEEKEKSITEKYHFGKYIKKEEDGKIYAVFQMFDDEYTAKNFLQEYLGKEFIEFMGIFEKITENYETEIETPLGIVKQKGKYVDNYYLKRTVGKTK